MRFRLLRRRLTISAPRMAVRSAMPWPFRWVVMAIVLGFCGAVALWAFEFGKNIAGLDTGSKEELAKLRVEVAQLREERDKAQSVANTSGSLLTAERAAQDKLVAQIRLLETENRALRDDLGFFEKLIPASGADRRRKPPIIPENAPRSYQTPLHREGDSAISVSFNAD